METSADLKAALAATAWVCEKCGGSYKDVHLPGYTHYETDAGEPCPRYHYGRCPHCTNGVVFSDERARELLERLKRAEEALDTMPVQAMAIIGPPYTVTFSPSAFELIRAARAKEGAQNA